tara:strand:- start:1016 stop:1873 length:858 start_codon:yes stop_codon:yes gene_type:complete
MKIKFYTMLLALFAVSMTFSQSNLNAYKYIIVPTRFDFLKEPDQYRLNGLTKFLFEKYGFQALMEGENYPEDYIRNRCLGLKSDLIKDSGMFKTKLSVQLKDCNDQIVFTTQVGESREKEYSKAYTEALRNAFNSFEGIPYKYEPKPDDNIVEENITVKNNNEASQEIQQLKEEIKSLKTEKQTEVVPTEMVEIVEDDVQGTEELSQEITINEHTTGILYAQAIENGFQLVDSSPKVRYKIKTTSLNNVYLVENKSAILHKKGENWILEYYLNGTLKQEELNIKF